MCEQLDIIAGKPNRYVLVNVCVIEEGCYRVVGEDIRKKGPLDEIAPGAMQGQKPA